MTLQLLQTTQKSHSEEKTFVIVPPQVYKYYELLKRKNITIVKDELYKTTYYIGDSFVHVINSSGNFNTTFYYADGVLVAEKDHLKSTINKIFKTKGLLIQLLKKSRLESK